MMYTNQYDFRHLSSERRQPLEYCTGPSCYSQLWLCLRNAHSMINYDASLTNLLRFLPLLQSKLRELGYQTPWLVIKSSLTSCNRLRASLALFFASESWPSISWMAYTTIVWDNCYEMLAEPAKWRWWPSRPCFCARNDHARRFVSRIHNTVVWGWFGMRCPVFRHGLSAVVGMHRV